MTTNTWAPSTLAETSGACAMDTPRAAWPTSRTNESGEDDGGQRRQDRQVCRLARNYPRPPAIVHRLRDSAAYRVKRAPLAAVGVAFAAGMLTAVLSAQCVRVLRRSATLKEW